MIGFHETAIELRTCLRSRSDLKEKARNAQGVMECAVIECEITKIDSRIQQLSVFLGGWMFSKQQRQINAAKKSHKKHSRSRQYCIEAAQDMWNDATSDEEVIRIGDMSNLLWNVLQNDKQYWAPTDAKRVYKWLTDARKSGELIIPPAASRPGPSKK